MINLKNEHALRALKNIKEDEIYICEKEKTAFKYDKENGWVKQDLPKPQGEMDLYSLNQQLIDQLPNLDENTIKSRLKEFNSEFITKVANKYYMLYGRQLNYFTLFKIGNGLGNLSTFGDEIVECLKTLGDIKSIDKTEDGLAYEIWVKTKNNGCHSLYLFGYDNGVIECQ